MGAIDVAGPFVGRTEELAVLGHCLASARDGRRQVVVVSGPSGIGKTTLVRTFLGAAAGDDAVHTVGCDEAESTLRFGMLDQLAVSLGADPFDWQAEVGSDPFTAGAVLIDLLGRQPEEAVTVLIDDVQWADTSSLRGLVFALRRIPHDRLLLVATVRDVRTDDRIDSLITLAESEGALVPLSGLDLDDVRSLAARLGVGALSDRSLHRLLEQTDGNALYLRLLLEDHPTVHDPRDLVPATSRPLEATVADRLAALGPSARTLVEAAAVLGVSSSLADVARLAAADDPAFSLADAIDDASRAALVRFRDEALGRRLLFTHPIIRLAVYQALDGTRRTALHRAAAEVVQDPQVSLRHEVDATIGTDDALAERVAQRAALDEDSGSWSSAAAWSLSAGRLRSDRADREQDVLRAALCLVVAGELPAAASLMTGTDEFADCSLLRFLRGRIAALAGDLAGGLAELVRAWEGHDDVLVSSMAASHLSAVALAIGEGEESGVWAKRAMDLGDHGASRLDVDPLSRYLIATLVAGHADEGMAYAVANDELFALPGEDRFDGLLGRGVLHHALGDSVAAAADLDAVAEGSRRRGPFHLWCYAQTWDAAAAYQGGRWDDALRYALEATSAADTEAWSFAVGAYCALSMPLTGRGDFEAAAAALDQARTSAARAGNPGLLRNAIAAADAWLALTTGDHEAAADIARPWLTGPAAGLDVLAAPPLVRTYALASLRSQDLNAVAGGAEVLARQPNPAGPAWAAILRLAVASAAGQSGEALDHYADALKLVAHVKAPFEWAQLSLELGAFRRREGARRAAVDHLEEARLALTLLGATPFVARCDSELARSGLKPRPRRGGPAGLTPTERIIVGMVRKGGTNREIASELVVSVKTVEYHLSNLYRKFGVANRTSLLQALAP